MVCVISFSAEHQIDVRHNERDQYFGSNELDGGRDQRDRTRVQPREKIRELGTHE